MSKVDPTLSVKPVIPVNLDGDYKTVAASATNTQLGVKGALGDVLAGVLIVPATTTPGAVSVTDGASTLTLFAGGTVADIKPFVVSFGTGIYALGSGGWKLTTGASVSAVAFGKFT
jgi:hypothetical protein